MSRGFRYSEDLWEGITWGFVKHIKTKRNDGQSSNHYYCFLKFRKERVDLNDKVLSRDSIPQGLIQQPSFLFNIHYSDLFDDLSTDDYKFFVDYSRLLSVVNNMNGSAINLKKDFVKVNNWTFQWKMSFTLIPTTEWKNQMFSRKSRQMSHPLIYFNCNFVKKDILTFRHKRHPEIHSLIQLNIQKYL